MKRLIVVLCVAGLLAALPLSHLVAARPAPKVEICHITPNYAPSVPFQWIFPNNWVVAHYGHIISVSENAAQAHYDHGDPVPVFLTEDFDQFIPGFDNDSECVIFVAAP